MKRQTYRRKRSVDRSVRQLARYTTRKKGPCKTLRGRKYTCRKASRKTHPAQDVAVKSGDTYKRSVHMWMVCAQ